MHAATTSRARPLARAPRVRWLREAAWATLVSRAIVWGVGIPALLALDVAGWRDSADPQGLTGDRMGDVGEVLGGPAFRWDSVHYATIAHDGYDTAKEVAFPPLYPLLVGAGERVVGSAWLAGTLVSLVALVVALVLLGRLVELDFGAPAAGRTLWLVALFPAAIFLSAVYTEALFLALSVGAFLCARQGRWAWAGALGALAAGTRSVGVAVAVPLLVLYLYGPRADRPDPTGPRPWWRPRHPLGPDAAWIALVPAGLAAFCLYTWARFDEPLALWTAQELFHREFHGPLAALPMGVWHAGEAAWDWVSGGGVGPGKVLNQAALVGVALAAVVATVDCLRRLPLAYGAYAVALLVPALSAPSDRGPLNATPRFFVVIFPLFVWAAVRLDRPRWFRAGCVLSGLGLAYCSARFSTWRWVA